MNFGCLRIGEHELGPPLPTPSPSVQSPPASTSSRHPVVSFFRSPCRCRLRTSRWSPYHLPRYTAWQTMVFVFHRQLRPHPSNSLTTIGVGAQPILRSATFRRLIRLIELVISPGTRCYIYSALERAYRRVDSSALVSPPASPPASMGCKRCTHLLTGW